MKSNKKERETKTDNQDIERPKLKKRQRMLKVFNLHLYPHESGFRRLAKLIVVFTPISAKCIVVFTPISAKCIVVFTPISAKCIVVFTPFIRKWEEVIAKSLNALFP